MTQTDTATEEPNDGTSAEEFLERVRRVVEILAEAVDEESDTTAAEAVEDARELLVETEELLDTVDLSELLDAIDLTDVPDAVDAGDVPEAVAEGDPKEAIELTELPDAVDLTEMWDATDVREFRRNLRELQDAVGDAEDDLGIGSGGDADDGDGMIGDDGLVGGDDDDDELVDGDVTDEFDVSMPGGRDDSGIPSEVAETAMERKVRDAADRAREQMLEARNRLKEETERAYEEVQEKTRETGHPSSRNPTAASTLAMASGDERNPTRFSSVPAETRHSSSPNPERVYSDRIDEEGGDGNG